MQITTSNSRAKLTLRVSIGCLAFAGLASGAQAQTYYYPTSNTPVYYNTPGYQGQTVWYNYSNQYYQNTYSTPANQAAYPTQYYEVAQADTTVQTTTYTQQVQVVETGGDPYGFLNWLNATRAAYGLSAVGHDPNLSSWAAVNNNHQASSGIGHFVMGPARRQNSAMGGFPGIETMWMASPAHRAALLVPTIRWIGIAGAGGCDV